MVALGVFSSRKKARFTMQLTDFDYVLPEELIAQFPADKRDESRLMMLDRKRQAIDVGIFSDITRLLTAGDLLVINDTRVIPARLLGRKATGGKIEVFLVRRDPGPKERWECMTKSSHPPQVGSELVFSGELSAVVVGAGEGGFRTLEFFCAGDFQLLLEELGRIPLPPYIKREAGALDRDRYQTVFARQKGALAAPTAGLHFTAEMLERLQLQGVEIRPLTLHVGLGTFMPVRTDNLLQHRMHLENYSISPETAAAVNRARLEGRRVIALGTTTTRALESAAVSGKLIAGEGSTQLYILPGFKFQVIDGLLTNFHLPKSTLLMLVSAFAGRDFVLAAYRRAVAEKFRFFSYGDAMLIV
jgi:S-adenosylmethionine:tRNA ribosyltransferase-isomerase